MTTLDALAADIAQAVVEHGFNPRALDEADAWNMGRAEQAVAARLERALDEARKEERARTEKAVGIEILKWDSIGRHMEADAFRSLQRWLRETCR